MIKTKTILICLLLGAAICLPQVMRAQVTIGANTEPKSFSLLELAGDTRGLRMPQLTAVQRDTIDFGTYAASDAKGLMIFNTDNKCMEYWNGMNWVNICGDVSQPVVDSVAFSSTYNTFAANTTLFTGAVLVEGTGDDKTRGTGVLYTDIDAGVFNYTGGEGQVLPRMEFSHPSGLSVIIPAQTLAGSKGSAASGQITIRVSGIPSAAYAGKAFDLPITLLGTALTVRVNTGCGAYTGDKLATTNNISDNWLQFQCYNLGASNAIDPFTPNQYLHGAKYRFGAKEPSLTMAEDQASTTASDWDSKPVETDTDVWTTANNPCTAGWRLPTRVEWDAIIGTSNNTQSNVGGDSWTNSTNNYDTGKKLGDALFLPATGYRNYSNGTLDGRGSYGNYWSSTTYSTGNVFYMYFVSGSSSTSINYRTYGRSVRCVAE